MADSNAFRRSKTLRENINRHTGYNDQTVTDGVKRLLTNIGTDKLVQNEANTMHDEFPDPMTPENEFGRLFDYGDINVLYFDDVLDFFGLSAIDHIETTSGLQYIDTDYYFKPNSRIVVDMKFKEPNTQSRVFGSQCSNSSYATYAAYINGSGYWAYAHKNGDGNWIQTDVLADTNRHVFDYDAKNNQFKIDNGQTLNIFIMSGTANKNSQWPIKFFRANNSGDGTMNSSSDFIKTLVDGCWRAQIYENDVLVRDYKPVKRNSDNLMGFFDYKQLKFLPIIGG